MGIKTAMRLAFHIVDMENDNVGDLSNCILNAKRDIRICPLCYGYSTNTQECGVCSDYSRNTKMICVVQRPQDIFVMERGGFRGIYHVLHGVISPLDGIGPDNIKIPELVKRAKDFNVEEMVIALNSSVEGDATTLFIAKAVRDMNIRMTRLARGVPAGASIDYVDDVTLSRALEERQEVTC
jgi:recombination protein RecR